MGRHDMGIAVAAGAADLEVPKGSSSGTVRFTALSYAQLRLT